MKRCVLILLSLLVLLSGCQKNIEVSTPFYISTAERLSEVLAVDYLRPSINGPKKEDFLLIVMTRSLLNLNLPPDLHSQDELDGRKDWERNLQTNGLNQYCDINYHYRHFTYAGIAEGATIYADRVLWGREAGEDLSDMFLIPRYFNHNPIIASYPDFSVLYTPEDKFPATFRDFTSKRVALNGIGQILVDLSFVEIPPEDFDTVTFTVEIPVDVEYFFDYAPEIYEQCPNLKPEGRRLLKGSRTVKFDTSVATP